MENVLKKFDEARAMAGKAVSALIEKSLVLADRDRVLVSREESLRTRQAQLAKAEKAVESAKTIIMSQAELDRANNEVKDRIQSLENQEKEQRAEYVRKENELIARDEALNAREKELKEGLARLAEDKKTYKEKLVKGIANKLGNASNA